MLISLADEARCARFSAKCLLVVSGARVLQCQELNREGGNNRELLCRWRDLRAQPTCVVRFSTATAQQWRQQLHRGGENTSLDLVAAICALEAAQEPASVCLETNASKRDKSAPKMDHREERASLIFAPSFRASLAPADWTQLVCRRRTSGEAARHGRLISPARKSQAPTRKRPLIRVRERADTKARALADWA